MPAPLQASKKSTVTVAKRTTRSSVGGSKITSSTLQKTKNVSLGVKHGITSKNENNQNTIVKRKAEKSPISGNSLKRSAFGDITNAVEQKNALDAKKALKKPVTTVSAVNKVKLNATKPATVTSTVSRLCRESAAKITAATKQNDAKKDTNIKKAIVLHRVKGKTELTLPAVKTSKVEVQTREEIKITTTSITTTTTKPVTRQSIRLSDVAATSSSEESSLYVSALEELNITDDKQSNVESNGPPPGVEDFDKENWDDPNQMSHYAFDIFNYLKSREAKYTLSDYMPKQTSLTSVMRPLLVDWMVEVQESFELTHETLYLAVKIVDKFLSKVIINKDTLQLVGATALFIASKYEERSPPELEDIVYIGDKAYDDKNVIKMEKKILKNLDFDLGFPLSYRFLRRYARCSKAPMQLLTLARFILEYCLMEYSLITLSDSKMAAASLHIARIMTKTGGWNLTLEYYSGYKLNDFKNIAVQMNDVLHKKPRSSLATVRNKYSHEIFFSVAKTPLVDNVQL